MQTSHINSENFVVIYGISDVINVFNGIINMVTFPVFIQSRQAVHSYIPKKEAKNILLVLSLIICPFSEHIYFGVLKYKTSQSLIYFMKH